MKYPITEQTEQSFNEGSNYTERRPHFFEAVFMEDYEPGNECRGKAEVDPTSPTGDRPNGSNKPKDHLWQSINEIP